MQQLSLTFETGLSQRYQSLRECMASQVYARGHGRVAGKLDLAPSKLTEKLAGLRSDGKRSGITLDELEQYLADGDHTPIFYLVDKYLRDPQVQQAEALARLALLADQLPALLAKAGLQAGKPAGRR